MNRIGSIVAAGIIGGVAIGSSIGFATLASADPTDDALKEQLTFMREEERLARDLYTALDAHYAGDTRPFTMIKTSEQQHFDQVGALLVQYKIADPSAGKAAGTYGNAELQKMYTDLLARGKKSLDEAYKVGISVEKADIADLTQAISAVSQADARALFERLRTASQHHLSAFERAADGDLTGPGQRAHRGMQNQPGQQQRSKDGSRPGRMGTMRGTGNGTPPAGCPNS